MLPKLNKRALVEDIQSTLTEMGGNADYPVEHLFSDGLYGRQVKIPAGHAAVGKIHRKGCINVLLYGTMVVSTDDDELLIQGPFALTSEPGIQKTVLALTDCAWLCIHATEQTDLESLENELIAPNYEALEDTKCLG